MENYHFETFYKPLIVLSNIFALPVPTLPVRKTRVPIPLALYAILMVLILISSLVWSINELALQRRFVNSDQYIDTLIVISLVVTNVVSISSTVLVHRKHQVQFVKTIKEVDRELNVNDEFKTKKYLFLAEFGFLHGFVFFCSAYESWNIITVSGLNDYTTHVIFYLNIYMVMLTVMKVYHFSMALKYRFAVLNRKLLRFGNRVYDGRGYKIYKIEHSLYFYRKNHLLLCDLVVSMSNAFGAQVLCITAVIVIYIIQAFNVAVNYRNIAQDDSREALMLILVCVWNTGMFIVFAIMIAASCEQTIEEKNKAQKICHKILNNLSVHLNRSQDMFREELLLLAQQIQQCDVCFSAVGFFPIDHSLLLTIFGSVASYVIIVIQVF